MDLRAVCLVRAIVDQMYGVKGEVVTRQRSNVRNGVFCVPFDFEAFRRRSRQSCPHSQPRAEEIHTKIQGVDSISSVRLSLESDWSNSMIATTRTRSS